MTKKFRDPMTEGVRWTEKYDDMLSKFWESLPDTIRKSIATLAIFIFAVTLKGEWMIILVTATKHWKGSYTKTNLFENKTLSESLENMKMNYWMNFWIGFNIGSFGIYFILGGFLHWYFYVKRRHLANEWKIQPNKWLSPELERHEIILGSITLFISNIYMATLACYIFNENPSTVYYEFDEYGWVWFFVQIPIVFFIQDYVIYLTHRFYHTPFMYKHFHKLHHKYKQPTAFSVTAVHPVEMIHFQINYSLPLFIIPVHWLTVSINLMYNAYFGTIEHSGINFKAHWWQPWQPEAEFHDQHHELFHVNFAFNTTLWDKIHGTSIKKNKIYTEETFHNRPLIIGSQNHDD